MYQPLPKHPNIVLLANNIVGLQVAKYLRQREEHIVALIVHSGKDRVLTEKIVRVTKCKYVFTERQLRDPRILQKIKSLKPDIAVCAFFSYILKKEFIQLFPCGVINCHNSYLPYNRGKYPHVWALATGSPYGVSIHFIDEGIDTGNIIARRRIKPLITDTSGTLYTKCLVSLVRLFKDTWPKMYKNTIKPIRQNNASASHHFAREIGKLDMIEINKKYRALNLINQIRSRSFKDRTYAYFIYKKQKIYVKITLAKQSKL